MSHIERLQGYLMPESHIPQFRPRITVPEARKLLGSRYKHMTDNQVLDLIVMLTMLARNNLEYLGSNKSLGSDTIEV